MSVLRQVRNETIPLVPELAPWLPGEWADERDIYGLDVIQEELVVAIEDRGVDPDSISAPDFNKLSRHTLAGGIIRLQRSHLIEGEGDKARFTPDAIDEANFNYGWGYFLPQVLALQDAGARYVESTFSAGRDAAHSWFPLLKHRYEELGQRGLDGTPIGSPLKPGLLRARPSRPIPLEGRSVDHAMRTRALGANVQSLIGFVRYRKAQEDMATRVQMAHDIAPQFLGGAASSHIYDLGGPRPRIGQIKGEIEMNPRTGRHRIKLTAESRRKLFPHLPDDDLPNARMKCAAHGAVKEDDTDMMYFVHAAINLAADHYSGMW